MKGRPWTDEETDVAREMWADGVPAKIIAAKLGRTKSAVLSRVNRTMADFVPGETSRFGTLKRLSNHPTEFGELSDFNRKMEIWQRETRGAGRTRRGCQEPSGF